MTSRVRAVDIVPVLCIVATTLLATYLAPDTWQRPVVALLFMTFGMITWSCGFVGGRRRDRVG